MRQWSTCASWLRSYSSVQSVPSRRHASPMSSRPPACNRSAATTSPTNDKGVDVVGTIKLGISAVREVIQVKRHRGTIHRPVLDQLRGSLHRFNAVRGTIITTGRFSKGVEEAAFERGAAPITLIDGEKLLDLLIDNGIGVSKRPLEYLEFAPEKLAQFEGETGEEEE